MRRFFAVPLALSIALAAYACNDDSTPSAAVDASSPDATTNDGALAPSDGSAPTTDGTTTEAGPLGGAVTVHTLDQDHHPVAGTQVYFVEEGATTATVVTSDANGVATYTFAKPGSVHVFQFGGGPASFVTSVMSVSAGDSYTFTGTTRQNVQSIQSVQGSYVPTTLVDGGASLVYNVSFGACDQGGTFNAGGMMYDNFLDTDCYGPDGKINEALYALGSEGLAAYAYRSYVDPIDGGGVYDVQNFAASDYVLPAQWTGTYTGTAPAWVNQVASTMILPVDGADLIRAGTGFGVNQVTSYTFTTVQPAIAPQMMLDTSISTDTGTMKMYARHLRRLPTGGYTEDYGAFLSRFTSASADANGATPTLTWAEETPIASDKTMSVVLAGTYLLDGSSRPIEWHVVFPAKKGVTSAMLPAVPTDLAAYVSTSWTLKDLTARTSAQAGYSQLASFPDDDPDHRTLELPSSIANLDIEESELQIYK